MSDRLSTLYQDAVAGSYDCVDRILLNGYFGLGHSAGGFRLWWRQLTGSDQTLDKTHLMRLAGRFSRRLRGYARAHQIPVVDCRSGEDKHQIAEEYLEKTKIRRGVFLILVGRAQAPLAFQRPTEKRSFFSELQNEAEAFLGVIRVTVQ